MRLTVSPRRPWPVAVAAFTLLTLPGCGDGRNLSKVYPVSGKILVNGQPAKDCLITLNPTAPPKSGAPVTPTGYTDDNGSFQITSYANNDGAPPGEYVVT